MIVKKYWLGSENISKESASLCGGKGVQVCVYMTKDELSKPYFVEDDIEELGGKDFETSFFLYIHGKAFKILDPFVFSSRQLCPKSVDWRNKVAVIKNRIGFKGVVDLEKEKLIMSFCDVKRIDVVNENIFAIRFKNGCSKIYDRNGSVLDKLEQGKYKIHSNFVEKIDLRSRIIIKEKVSIQDLEKKRECNRNAVN